MAELPGRAARPEPGSSVAPVTAITGAPCVRGPGTTIAPRQRAMSRQACLEEHAAVGTRPAHADLLVEAERRRVVGAHEEADRGCALEQKPAEIAEPAGCIALTPGLGVDPDLLELDRARRPGRRLGLEEDRAVLGPEPGAALLDLRRGPPPEAGWIPSQRIDAELLLVRQSACRDEQVEIRERRRPQSARPRFRRLVEDVDGLPGPVLARPRHREPGGTPELADRFLLADDHARHAGGRVGGERVAPSAGRDDICAEVAGRVETVLAPNRAEDRVAAPSRVLEEDALDRVARAELEHLVESRIDQHGAESSQ